MNDYVKALLTALAVIHTENLIVLSTMTDKDMDDPYIKNIDEMFNKAIDEVLKK